VSVELPPRATASDRRAEVALPDDLAARQRAIPRRLAGRPTTAIGAAGGRSAVWFRQGWGRSLEAGPEGLDGRTRANHHGAQRIPPELERAILSGRRRRQAHATPATRSCLIGAPAILAELKGLGVGRRDGVGGDLPAEQLGEVPGAGLGLGPGQGDVGLRLRGRMGSLRHCSILVG
jgi:hypothetical protein